MDIPLQITVRNIEVSDATRAMIRAHAAKLDQFYDRIMGCRVLVGVPQRYRIGQPIAYCVRIDLTVPGGELVVKRKPREDLVTAVQDAFDAAGRRLQDYARVLRGDVKQRSAPGRAVVRRLFPYEGYGFLETPEGEEIYFHRNSVLDGAFDALEVGATVRYSEGMGERGPQATSVALPRRGRRKEATRAQGT
jgi:ribosome-associated translation inhibitor RaiA/cold shock CspA family protein